MLKNAHRRQDDVNILPVIHHHVNSKSVLNQTKGMLKAINGWNNNSL